jgi:predicted DCC family thiol-disulfide oxidoreductase YuxK
MRAFFVNIKATILTGMHGYHTKSDAVPRILQTLGGFWGTFNAFRIIPKGISDGIYDLVARNRYFLSGKPVKSCRIPYQST